jgi:molecular chaperone GrpE
MTKKEHKHKDKEEKRTIEVTLSREEFNALKEKAEQAKLYFDKLLRLQAEFDNAKKRLEKEKLEFIKFAEGSLMLELIPIMEDFERALESANKKHDIESLKKGIEIIVKHFKNLLTKKGLKEMEAIGKPFDPDLHEALLQEGSSEYPENTVLEEYQKGYFLGDMVLRHAKVKTSKQKTPKDEPTGQAPKDEPTGQAPKDEPTGQAEDK